MSVTWRFQAVRIPLASRGLSLRCAAGAVAVTWQLHGGYMAVTDGLATRCAASAVAVTPAVTRGQRLHVGSGYAWEAVTCGKRLRLGGGFTGVGVALASRAALASDPHSLKLRHKAGVEPDGGGEATEGEGLGGRGQPSSASPSPLSCATPGGSAARGGEASGGAGGRGEGGRGEGGGGVAPRGTRGLASRTLGLWKAISTTSVPRRCMDTPQRSHSARSAGMSVTPCLRRR